jgi:hypothetical protein
MAELNVSRKTIAELFTGMKGGKFIIPEYQRPYKWGKEECETLWQDLTGFFYDEISQASSSMKSRRASFRRHLRSSTSFPRSGKRTAIVNGTARTPRIRSSGSGTKSPVCVLLVASAAGCVGFPLVEQHAFLGRGDPAGKQPPVCAFVPTLPLPAHPQWHGPSR